MSCPVFDYQSFLEDYPEFECYSSIQLTAVSRMAFKLFSGFGAIREDQRNEALGLAVAHLALLRFDKKYAGGSIQKLESRDESITYSKNPASNDGFGFASTIYGSQLQQLFKRQPIVGFVSRGYSC
jgi:hypothetical protein